MHLVEAAEHPSHDDGLGLVRVYDFDCEKCELPSFGVDGLAPLVAVHVTVKRRRIYADDPADESLGELRVLLAELLDALELFAERSIWREVEFLLDWLDEFGPGVLYLFHFFNNLGQGRMTTGRSVNRR